MNEAAIWGAVAIGGAIGALLRGTLYRTLAAAPAKGVEQHIRSPLGLGRATLCVNVVGSFFLGVLWAVYAESPPDDPARIFWLSGFCGSLTTFSTFCADAIRLADSERRGRLIGFLLGNATLSVVAFGLGRALVS